MKALLCHSPCTASTGTECEGKHAEDARSGEFEEGRRGWKKCACLIHVSGTVGIVNIELNENIELARPSSILPSGAQRASRVGRQRVGSLQISSCPSAGEPRAPAPARSPASLGEAAKADFRRSAPMGVAVRSLERLAICLGHRQARNRHWLAS